MKKSIIAAFSAAIAAVFAALAMPSPADDTPASATPADTISQPLCADPCGPLCEEDYSRAADSLGVDVAAIHAVVEVEAGAKHKGIWEEGKPLVAFSAKVFRSQARKRNINLTKHTASCPDVFTAPKPKKYGSYEAAQWARVQQAMAIDSVAAINSAFWGMFQISGQHWKLCGCQSEADFVERMSTSEREQLEMFVAFLRNTGMDAHLRSHQWARFARRYNGPSYARRGYHTKLARAYKKYSTG
ncbi:MAG: N-acetylmuramidase family protein [Clostridium sp.]|nr:N-acetylmuramidase family protein [Clostridium sp.]